MTLLLAIDTATPQVGVALWGTTGPIASFSDREGRRHGELLAPAIRSLTDEAGLSVADIEAVAVDVGPGLFTGLRVGIATAQALASALGVPAIGITSLEILAYPHRHQRSPVLAVVDARRREVFRAMYGTAAGKPGSPPVEPGWLEELIPAGVMAPAALAAELAPIHLHGSLLVVGDGALRYADVLAAARNRFGGEDDAYPSALVLAEMAAARLAAGAVTDARGLRPRYLRDADVRIGWEQRAPATGAERRG